jgi:hypothetical protein
VPHAREPKVSAFGANAVVQEEVTAIHADLDPIAEKDHNSVSRHGRIVWGSELG